MKVLDLTTIYPNEIFDNEGRSVAHLNRALSAEGVGCTTIVLRPWAPRWLAGRVGRWNHLAVKDRIETANGSKIFFAHYAHIPRSIRLDVSAGSMASRAGRLIRKHGIDFDIIHGQSICPAALASFILASRYKVPFIITLRDDIGHLDHILAVGGRRLRAAYGRMFEHAGAIFAQGPAVLEDVSRYVPPEGSAAMLLAPNGTDLAGIDSVLASLSPAGPHKGRHIVSVCNLYRLKGIHENLQALRLVEERGVGEWEYTVVGDGPYMAELGKLSNELGLADKVKFAGKVSHAEALRYIRDADIFSMPSWMESFGNVYAEAAACGRPVIGCAGQGAGITVRHGETGLLVPARDVGALADALEYLITHPEEARRMGERGRQNIKQFTWEKTAGIYRGVMERIIACRCGGSFREG